MKNKVDAMTPCQGSVQNFGGHFTFVGPYELEFNDSNVSSESIVWLIMIMKGIRC